RNIRTLFNFDPPATDEEIRAASLQFVRKISGFHTPSKTNEAIFQRSVDEVAVVARKLVDSLTTTAPSRDRDVEAAKARERGAHRCGRAGAWLGRRWRGRLLRRVSGLRRLRPRRVQIPNRRSREHPAIGIEARSMAGTIPSTLGCVPRDDAPEVRTDRGVVV